MGPQPDYDRFLNSVSRSRRVDLIRDFQAAYLRSGRSLAPLFAGMPNASQFPIEEVVVRLRDGSELALGERATEEAFQYGQTEGIPDLLRTLRDLFVRTHRLGAAGDFWARYDLQVTNGSQDGLCKAVEMLLDPTGGTGVVVSDYAYAGALSMMGPYRPRYVTVETDALGMVPARLREAVEASEVPPALLYINTTGANPTGAVVPEDRRRAIYDICSEHDILILEDDPYYFLQFDPAALSDRRLPTFINLDRDGRVLRFESFSKLVSAGMRVGFVVGPRPLVERIRLHTQISNMHASNVAQALLARLLDRWGHEGLLDHARGVAAFYRARRDAVLRLAERHLAGLCEWTAPEAGMYLWLRVRGCADTTELARVHALRRGVLVMPGSAYSPDPGRPCPFLRLSFSVAGDEEVEVAFAALAEVIREEYGLAATPGKEAGRVMVRVISAEVEADVSKRV